MQRHVSLATLRLVAVLAVASVATESLAANTPGDVYYLRTDCGDAPDNGYCVSSLATILSELHDPTGDRSVPGPGHRIRVDIGPGEFDLDSTDYLYCDGLSHISFVGSGREVTTLKGGGYDSEAGSASFFDPYTVKLTNCEDIEFKDLTIDGEGSSSGVVFEGDGSTYWYNVEIEVSGAYHWAWVDASSTSIADSVHYWYNSLLEASAGASQSTGSLYTIGGTHRIVGSTLRTSFSDGNLVYGVVWGDAAGFDIRLQGSRIVAENLDTGANATAVFLGYAFSTCASGSVFTAEGSEIEATATGAINGIWHKCTGGGAKVETQGTLFRLLGGSTLRRFFDNPGGVNSPYSLGAGANPPSLGTGWMTVKGMDTFNETDCSSTKCAGTSQGSQTHLLTFDAGCTGTGTDYGPWWDATLQKCRGT